MRATLTVSLPGRSKQLIERAARESGLTTSEYVRLAIGTFQGVTILTPRQFIERLNVKPSV